MTRKECEKLAIWITVGQGMAKATHMPSQDTEQRLAKLLATKLKAEWTLVEIEILVHAAAVEWSSYLELPPWEQ
jgi:hypothetical protein